MVSDFIAAEGISNQLVLQAMEKVQRHEFVSKALQPRAYLDMALPIGSKQTISPPFIVAYMTETIDPQPTDKVLEVGTGSGYQAAVLGEIVDQVYSVEIVSDLAASAKARLEELGYDNVHTRAGDGYLGWPEHAPFDKIIVTCSPEDIPEPLIEQLKEGGLMVIPVGQRYQQSFYLLEKRDGKLEKRQLIPTLFVPMTGESEERRRIQPDPLHPEIVNGDFENDINEDQRTDNWHYQRQTRICLDTPIRGTACLRFENSEPGELSQALQGTAIDGRRIGSLNISVWTRLEKVIPAPSGERASLVVHFYDTVRRELGAQVVTTWRGTLNWQQSRRRIAVPARAREMIFRLGLNGSTGTMDVDDLRMIPNPR